jgi:alpha-beta hydrolase superfamily lysophospholipase
MGARVTAVIPDSPAAAAGLKVGDVVSVFGSHKIENSAGLVARVRAASVEDPIVVEVLRDKHPLTLSVQLIRAPKENDPAVETIYSSIDVDGSLRRTLVTVPKSVYGKLPGMLLIGGIGCYTVDNPNDPHDAYRFLAHDLARAGIVVMRVEKSGIGDSQGGPCFDTDFVHESHSYQVALDVLVADPHVDPSRVFLFGHSIGVLIAPRLALKKPTAGIIAADGVGVNWFEYELANLRRQSELDGDTPTQTDALMSSKELCMHRLLMDHQPESEIEKTNPECKQRNAYPVAAPYMQQVAALNIADPWTKVKAPVLAIYGTADFITAESDHRRIAAIVNAQHPGSAQVRLIEGMDHHLEQMGTPQLAYDARVKHHKGGPYAEELSGALSAWICSRAQCTSQAAR